MASKPKGLSIKISPDDIVYSSITRSRNDYNNARVVAKLGDKSYLTISCEWEGETVPSFAMDLMGTLTASEIEPNIVVSGREDDFAEYEAGRKETS